MTDNQEITQKVLDTWKHGKTNSLDIYTDDVKFIIKKSIESAISETSKSLFEKIDKMAYTIPMICQCEICENRTDGIVLGNNDFKALKKEFSGTEKEEGGVSKVNDGKTLDRKAPNHPSEIPENKEVE